MSEAAPGLVWPRPVHEMARQEEASPRFLGGHSLCSGCGIPMVVRTVLNSIETPTVVVNATGCLEVATTRYPNTAWNVPWLHVAFENAAAVMSGIEAAARALRRRGSDLARAPHTFVVFAGDGGSYDIGLQALSGALDRGHRLIYVCYDNEAYMNTGIQRSSATPAGARTTTSPVGSVYQGSARRRKDLTGIVVAHRIPYVAQAAGSDFADLSRKSRRAAAAVGPAFLNVLTSCPLGWGMPARDSLPVVAAAVESGFWPLYEVVDGHYRLTYEPVRRVPVQDWLRGQSRFQHLHATDVARIQAEVDADWERLVDYAARDQAYFESPS